MSLLQNYLFHVGYQRDYLLHVGYQRDDLLHDGYQQMIYSMMATNRWSTPWWLPTDDLLHDGYQQIIYSMLATDRWSTPCWLPTDDLLHDDYQQMIYSMMATNRLSTPCWLPTTCSCVYSSICSYSWPHLHEITDILPSLRFSLYRSSLGGHQYLMNRSAITNNKAVLSSLDYIFFS